MSLNLSEFNKIRDLIYLTAGISLKESKMDFVSRRVDSRMKALDLKTERDYLRYLSFNRQGNEMEELINLIVTSETYFFRDYPQLSLLAEEVLPAIVSEKGEDKRLNVLCAGCSTGDEPYTMAIILRELLDNPDEWTLRIDALDINRNNLMKAREGIYTDHSLRETPYLYRDRYFIREGELHRLDSGIKKWVNFMKVNLFNQADMSTLFAYDIVLCRNVLIYFDYESAGRVMEYLYEVMNPGGYIFLGSAESVGRVTTLFKIIRFGRSFVYQK